MIHHARTAPQPPSKAAGHPIPDRLEQIVLACLEKAPEKRPASASALWRDLGEVTFTTPWTVERAESWWREHLPDLARPSPGGDFSSDAAIVPVG
jgi:eukaryotic-like serine/threonine-protein kinase